MTHTSPTRKEPQNAPSTLATAEPTSADGDIANFAQVNHIQITPNQDGQRLDNFLLTKLKGLPKSHIYKLIRKGEIRINKGRAKPEYKLQIGDVIRIAPVRLSTRDAPIISDDLAKGLLERIIHEDDGLILLDKPHGLAVHGGSGLHFGAIEALRHATGKSYLELVHRIDKDTSGLLLIAKKRSVLKNLQAHFRQKTIEKTYLAIAYGVLAQDEQQVDAPLLRYQLANGERRVKVASEAEGGKPSQTTFCIIKRLHNACLVAASPKTGRTHQIRVHAQYLRHPLLGDDKYHINDTSNAPRLCLHAHRLHIPDVGTFTSPLPSDMQAVVDKLTI